MIKTENLQGEILDLQKELVLLDNTNLTFSSLLLNKGTQKVGSVIVDWKYENLDSSRGTAKEGADVTEFQSSDRKTGDKNICQIIEKGVSVSETANAVTLENIGNLFQHELQNRMIEAKRDLEYYLINGKYTEEDATNNRQMKGLLNFIPKANDFGTKEVPSIDDLNKMARKMRQAGTASNDLVLLMDYNMTDVVSDLYKDKTYYQGVTNEFGSPAKKINLTHGSCYLYTVDAMPTDTMALVNLNYLKFASLRGLQYRDLARTGVSRKGYIVMENTMKFLNPTAAVKFTKTNA
ncbi:SU10 major capsid protein [Heyndrickxia sporothermodurans]